MPGSSSYPDAGAIGEVKGENMKYIDRFGEGMRISEGISVQKQARSLE